MQQIKIRLQNKMVQKRVKLLAKGEEVFMSGTLPVIWLLLGFNILFLGVFVYRRTRGSKPMGGAMSFFMQSMFVAVNCLSLFQDDLQRYLNWLTGSH